MTPKSLRLGTFTLDLERLCLLGPAGQADLRRKSFEVLRYLVEHAGRVVTKDEVMSAVWPDVTVGDESLAQCISEVRRAIGDQDQRIIKTVPRRGYLIDALVTAGDVADVAHPRVETASAPTLIDRPSIAVLAFTNMSGDPSQDYFSDGITEDIITELSRFAELLVIARNSSFRYKGQSVDVRQVGRELGVRYVLEGSVRRAGDRIRISAQLIDAATGAHRWAERYDRKLEDVFAVQDEVARTIVAVLAVHVNKAETERVLAKPPATWQAYDYYLRAADSCGSLLPFFVQQGRPSAGRRVLAPGAGHRSQLRPGSRRPCEDLCDPVGPSVGRRLTLVRRPSTAPTSPLARRYSWPPICLRLMSRSAGH